MNPTLIKRIKHWIIDNGPQGLEKLAVASNLSSETLKRVLCGNYVIKTEEKLGKLAAVLGCSVEDIVKKNENAS